MAKQKTPASKGNPFKPGSARWSSYAKPTKIAARSWGGKGGGGKGGGK